MSIINSIVNGLLLNKYLNDFKSVDQSVNVKLVENLFGENSIGGRNEELICPVVKWVKGTRAVSSYYDKDKEEEIEIIYISEILINKKMIYKLCPYGIKAANIVKQYIEENKYRFGKESVHKLNEELSVLLKY